MFRKKKQNEEKNHNAEVNEKPHNNLITELEEIQNKKEEEGLEGFKQQDSLRLSFEKVLSIFNKTVTNEVLYSEIDIEKEVLTAADIITLSKKVGLSAEIRRINILDITSGPCILIQTHKNALVFIDKNELYNPQTGELLEFKPENHIGEYTGYAIFFYEEDLSVNSFLAKTSFLFSSLKNFKHILIEVFILSFFINIFALAAPFFTMNIYDRVVPNSAFPTLFVLSIGMFVVYIFDWVFKVIKSYLTDFMSLSIGSDVDQVLLNKILSAKAPGINMSNGAKFSLFKELSMVREFYFSRFIPTLVDIPFLILFLAVLLFISPWLMMVPFVAGIIVFIVNILMQVPLQNEHGKMMNEDYQRSGVLNEAIAGSESIKIFNAIGKILYKWRRTLDKTYKTTFGYNLWVNISSNFSVFMLNIVTILMIIVGVFEISAGAMTTGGLIAASTISSRIMTTVIAFSSMIVRYRSIQNTLRHLEKIVNAPVEDEPENYAKKGPFKGNIKFKDVTFFYPGLKSPILTKCNFHITEKSKVAIIGRTGAGKSTITKLILGLDFSNGGQILIDGLDINNIHVKEIRANIGFMPQKSYFFHGTIKENILMGAVNISEEQYQRACDVAGVRLITELSGRGDDMIIQEGATNLSGGQQQIVALARAIINDPPIVIMDEPTNGMDSSLEVTFMENVKNYMKEKTFILITHKPTQLSLAERVILIDNSTVVIDDTKEKALELLSKAKKSN